MGKFVDLCGRKFGKLTVISRGPDKIDKRGKSLVQWHCKCDCGKEKIVLGTSMKGGLVKSCGCLGKQSHLLATEACRRHNTFDLSGDYGIGYTAQNQKFYFDLEDYNKLSNHYWSVNNNGYMICAAGCVRILMHRFLLNIIDENVDVDHIAHNKTDNRKEMLRIVTRTQNQMNLSLKSNNSSGVTGVNYDARSEKWVARIGKEKRRIHLGVFDKFDDAVSARKTAEGKYFQEYSYDNSINRETMI